MKSRADPIYEAWYGHTAKNIVAIGFGLVMSAMILLIPAPAWPRVVVVGVFGGMAVMLAAVALSRTPALRADAAGVTVRPFPLRFRAMAFYPWEDVVQIRILRSAGSKNLYVAIRLRDEAAWRSSISRARPQSRKALFLVLAKGPPGVDVNGWKLHPARLAAAVARFAPAVPVIDGATGSVISPAQS